MSNRVYYNRQTAGSAGFMPLQMPRFMFSPDTPAYAELARMSSDAKVLYALMLDRLSTNEMSVAFLENPWHNDDKLPVKLEGGYDARGRAYVHFHLTEMQKQLNVSYERAINAIEELLSYALIEMIEVTTGTGEPCRIYPLTPALTTALPPVTS